MDKGTDSNQLPLALNYEEPTAEELDLVVDYILAHRKAHVQQFLADHAITRSGTKTELRARLHAARDDGHVAAADLITLLDRIEGWGNQHIYLYRSSETGARRWQQQSHVERVLRDRRVLGLLNRRRPLLLPPKPTLSSIAWSRDRARLVWVERRTWEERVTKEDFTRGELMFRAFQERIERGVTTFDWDLVSREAALLIRRLPSGTDYAKERGAFEAQLEPLVHLSDFEALRPNRGITRIEESGEARGRQLAHETPVGSRATFTSRGRKRDAFQDPDLAHARQALGTRTTPVLGNFYWLPKEKQLSRDMHMKIYSGLDPRVGIFGEFDESEVNYVLSRVRHYCR